MKIIKRNGSEVEFDVTKIVAAVNKANAVVDADRRLDTEKVIGLASEVEKLCSDMNRAVSVEEIQDMVENHIMKYGAFELARKYITYRYVQSLRRRSNTTDDKILSLIDCENEEVKAGKFQ